MVQKIPVTVEVTKEGYELALGLAEFGLAAKEALKDGWQMGQDMPALMAAAMLKLIPALNGVEQLGAEAKEGSAFYAGIVLGIRPLADGWKKTGDDVVPV